MPAIPKNVEQAFSIELRDVFGTLDTATTGAPTVSLCKDGTWAAAANAATNTKAGYWTVTLTAAETNYREVVIEAVKVGFVTWSRTIYPEPDYTPARAVSISDILADTNDLQTRVPAALVSGRMDASVGAMAANVLTAAATHSDFGTEIANAVKALTADGLTWNQILGVVLAATACKLSGCDTNAPKFRDYGDTLDRISATTSSDGRLTVTLDLTGL